MKSKFNMLICFFTILIFYACFDEVADIHPPTDIVIDPLTNKPIDLPTKKIPIDGPIINGEHISPYTSIIGLEQTCIIKGFRTDYFVDKGIDEIDLSDTTPLYFTREISANEDDIYGEKDGIIVIEYDYPLVYALFVPLTDDPPDNLLTDNGPPWTRATVVTSGDGTSTTQSEAGRYYYPPVRNENGELLFAPGDEVVFVQVIVWRKDLNITYPKTIRPVRNLTRPSIDYSLYFDEIIIGHESTVD